MTDDSALTDSAIFRRWWNASTHADCVRRMESCWLADLIDDY